jgi:hypothetical protein
VPTEAGTHVVLRLQSSYIGRTVITEARSHFNTVTIEFTALLRGCTNRKSIEEKPIEIGDKYHWQLAELVLEDEYCCSKDQETVDMNPVLDTLRTASQTSTILSEEPSQSPKRGREENTTEIPPEKRARMIDIGIYDELLLKTKQVEEDRNSLNQEVKKAYRTISNLENELNSVLRIESKIYSLHKDFVSLARRRRGEPEECETPASQPIMKTFQFLGKSYSMNLSSYANLKMRRQPTLLMTAILQMLKFNLNQYYMPGDRKTERRKLNTEQIDGIISIARKFSIFAAQDEASIRKHIGRVFSASCTSEKKRSVEMMIA